jgi:hypothetical protein
MRSFLTTAKRAAAFVAIVWALAASFVAFEIAAVESMHLARAYPGVLGNLTLSRAVTRSTNCIVAPGEAPPERPAGVTEPQAAGGAWSMGLRMGWEAQALQSSTVRPDTLQELRDTIGQFASLLAVPAPRSFVPVNVAEANTELVTFVEQDADGTAHRLALTYSPNVCRLYKLGVLWGSAGITRAYIPGQAPSYAGEIRHYAREIGLPEAVWQPMTRASGRDATMQALNEESQAITAMVTKYLFQE